MNDLAILGQYLAAYDSPPPVLNVGLTAGENLVRRPSALSSLAATPSSPLTWLSLAKVQQAVKSKTNLTVPDVSGARLVALGKPTPIGGRTFQAGDQVFYDPGTKKVIASKTLAQLRAEESRAAAPKKAEVPSSSTRSVAAIQEVLRGVGSPASKRLTDGKWGPTTKGAWETAARAIGADATSAGKPGARQATVSTAAFVALEQRARAVALGVQPPLFGASKAPAKPAAAPPPAKKPAGPAPVIPSPAPGANFKVLELQRIVRRLGAKIAADGKYGPKTAGAWQSAASSRGLDPSIARVSGTVARVSPATAAALKAAAPVSVPKPAPPPPVPKPAKAAKPAAPPKPKLVAPKPTEPAKSGMTKVSVGQIQDIEIALGAKIKRDGFFGPKTVRAYQMSAKKRSLDPTISRAGPIEAWVVPATFEALSKLVGDKKPAPKGAPVSVKPEVQKPVIPAPSGAPATGLEPIVQGVLGTILKAFKKAPKTPQELQATWTAIAKSKGLDPRSALTPRGLEVLPATREKLYADAKLYLELVELLAQSQTAVPVKKLQQALRFANQTDAYKGRFNTITDTGTWNDKTEAAFPVYFNIPAANIPLWDKAFSKLVSADKKTIKLPSNFAIQAAKAAVQYAQLKGEVAKREQATKAAAGAAKALSDKAAQVVAGATDTVSVFALQQALTELRKKQQEGKLPGTPIPAVKLTGKWDAVTDRTFFEAFVDDIWGAPSVPTQTWDSVVKRLLVVSPAKGLSGLYGMFGELAVVTSSANYIKLPPALARVVQNEAAAFVARSAKSGEMKESEPDITVPVTKPSGGTVRGGPVLIQGKAPTPPPPPPPAPKPVTQAQVPVIETPEGEQVDLDTDREQPVPIAPPPTPAPAPAPIFIQAPPAPEVRLPDSAADAAAGAGGESSATQSVTGPTINIQVPQQAAAPEKSSSGTMIAIAVAIGTAFAVFAGRERKERRPPQ